MNKRRNGHESEPLEPTSNHEPFNDDTDELPVLVMDGSIEHASGDDTRPEPASDASSEARASSWVTGMEAEIKELQERWQLLDSELRRSEERSEAFRAESEEKDSIIARLTTEVAEHVKQIDELSAKVAEHESSIATLRSEKSDQAAKVAETSADLSAARSQAAVLEDRLQAAFEDRDKLSQTVAAERSRLVEVSTKKDALAETNARLATRVQDLEIYIEGRKDKWAALNHALEKSEAKVAEFESAVAASEKRFAGRGGEIEALGKQAKELERLRSEAEGRHKERELAFKETQTRLTEQAAEIERLRAAATEHDGVVRLANEKAEKHKAKLESLKQALSEKDETIRSLEAKIGSDQALHEHLQNASAEDRKKVVDLQRDHAVLGVERDRLSEDISQAKDRIQALEQELGDSRAHIAEIEAESRERRARYSKLEAEIAAKTEVIEAFDRNVERLSLLKLNLHAVSKDQAQAQGDAADPKRRGQPATRLFVPLNADDSDQAEYSLAKPIVTIGRSERSDIRILDAVVSRMHARLTTDEDSTVIEDLGSKNGLWVNSQPVERAVLHHGDVISFGKTHDFRYLELEPTPH
jgi:chromosome segregation ATPase